MACEGAFVPNHEVPTAIRTGVIVEIPEGHVGLICPRSGLSREKGLTVYNSPGVIDSGYRGEISVLLTRLTDCSLEYGSPEQLYGPWVERGCRIAQLVVVPLSGLPVEVDGEPLEVMEKARGENGFGSSG